VGHGASDPATVGHDVRHRPGLPTVGVSHTAMAHGAFVENFDTTIYFSKIVIN
jgi:hypothetical protein